MTFATIGELAKPKQWRILSKSEMVDDGYPVYGANGVIGHAAEFTHAEPTLLIGCRGTIGAIHISAPQSYATGNAMALDSLDSSRVDITYLARFLAWRGFADVTSGSSQPQLTRQNLLDVKIPLPHPTEQRRIAAILDQGDAVRAKRRHVLTHLDGLPQSVFRRAFGDPLVTTNGRPAKPLKEWIEPERPITYGILKPGPDIEGGVPYVRVADMQDRGIRVAGVRRTTSSIAAEYRRSTLRTGDLLMSIRGHVGRFAVVPPDLNGANITQDSARLAVRNPEEVAYVRAAMESPSVQHWMARRTKGAAVQGINLGDLREVPIYAPPEALLLRFATIMTTVDAQRNRASSASAPVENLFAALQSRAFRGEL